MRSKNESTHPEHPCASRNTSKIAHHIHRLRYISRFSAGLPSLSLASHAGGDPDHTTPRQIRSILRAGPGQASPALGDVVGGVDDALDHVASYSTFVDLPGVVSKLT